MTPEEEEEALWRNRFILLNLTRIGGTVVVLIGLAIWYGNVLREGGMIEVGLPLALFGLAISFWAPRRLSRMWRTPPAP